MDAAEVPAEAGGGARSTGLSERELAVLAFEKQWWTSPGSKEQAVRERFGLSSTRYYQVLNELIDKDAAVAAEPMLVRRLRRLRASRQRARAARRLGMDPR
ncbi:DUF3263 domain-containing protein [Actinokineospora bangkokensis]|uniref:DUF3263 domain-containing protein n=1 Tax=Actinokineospora bangkokensis TaxID=1193682 RepID=A0A1Q9LCT7_9PSEU|nr:DUF3263 domain-containing protein [Actinokineospora bangkokensis]OLR89829.1 hypothetical protein BJP25_02050 [Actinokineospora bangkokensis]